MANFRPDTTPGENYGDRSNGRTYDRDYVAEGYPGSFQSDHPNAPEFALEAEGHAGKEPRDYRRSDHSIREDLIHRLAAHDGIDAENIDVDVFDGLATLTGRIHSREEKWMAEDTAMSVAGVTDVNNHLRVESKS